MRASLAYNESGNIQVLILSANTFLTCNLKVCCYTLADKLSGLNIAFWGMLMSQRLHITGVYVYNLFTLLSNNIRLSRSRSPRDISDSVFPASIATVCNLHLQTYSHKV